MATETTYTTFKFANWKKTLAQAPAFWLALALGSYAGLRKIRNLSKEKQKLFLFSLFLGLLLLTKPTLWIYSFLNFAGALFILCLFGISFALDSENIKKLNLQTPLMILIVLCSVIQSNKYLYLGEELNHSEVYDLSLMEATLKKQDSYIASANYIFNKKNALENWSWLNYDITKASNQWTQQEKKSFISKVRKNKPKSLLVDSVLLGNSPPFLKEYYDQNFMHFWSSIYTRSYHFKESSTKFSVDHDGNYRVLLREPQAKLLINGRKAQNFESLNKDVVYTVKTDNEWKIQFIPEVPMELLKQEKRKASLYKNYLDEAHLKDYPF